MNQLYTSYTSLRVLTADFQKLLQWFLDIPPIRPALHSPHFLSQNISAVSTQDAYMSQVAFLPRTDQTSAA